MKKTAKNIVKFETYSFRPDSEGIIGGSKIEKIHVNRRFLKIYADSLASFNKLDATAIKLFLFLSNESNNECLANTNKLSLMKFIDSFDKEKKPMSLDNVKKALKKLTKHAFIVNEIKGVRRINPMFFSKETDETKRKEAISRFMTASYKENKNTKPLPLKPIFVPAVSLENIK